MWLFIQALDVWMFRDGKPFDSGAGHHANSLFPPTSFTVQGMLRSLAIDRSRVDWDDYAANADPRLTAQIGSPNAINPANQLGDFWMRGPYLARRDEEHGGLTRYFPLPIDVVQRGRQLHVLRDGSDLELDDEIPESQLWLAESKFATIYRGGRQFSASECLREDELFVREQRFGNAIDVATRTVRADEGMLYSASFIRPCADVGLLIEIPDSEPWTRIFPAPKIAQIFKFGGEGRSAHIERVEPPKDRITNNAHSESKLVLITPAYFIRGVPNINGITAHAVPRLLAFGGWDLVKRRPRPIRRYAPPGSVFMVNAGADLPELLTEQPIGELPLTTLGFGEYLRLPAEV